MCGRYQLSVKEDEIVVRFNVEVYKEQYRPSYNCAPSQHLPVISNEKPDQLVLYKWGLIPFWAEDPAMGNRMINAKAETIDQKPSFKHSFKRRRCLVLSNGFYEWKKENNKKIPYRILFKDEKLFAMAGIWDTWKDAEGRETRSYSIITTTPNALLKDIHNRMPVILRKEDEKKWLTDDDPSALLMLLKPYQHENMDAYKISSLVNSPANDSEEIIKPSEAA